MKGLECMEVPEYAAHMHDHVDMHVNNRAMSRQDHSTVVGTHALPHRDLTPDAERKSLQLHI
jgi:hypothetical protein